MKTGVIYARYSSEKQNEQSIEGQLNVCYDYAKRNEIVIIDTYIDRAMTGTNDNRASFQKMIKDSYKKDWDYVIVYKLDRFSRNKYEATIHKHTLKENGVKLLSAMENIPDSPEGIILESLLEGMNQYYSAELAQKVTRGMRETRKKGLYTGGFIPFGYKLVGRKIEINEDQVEIARDIFNRFLNGERMLNIMNDLNSRGIRNNRGNPFNLNTLHNMILNEKYIGIYRIRDEVFDNIYPAIIDKDTFEEAGKRIRENHYGRKPKNAYYLLKGKMYCGNCGATVSAETGTSKNGKMYRFYKCSARKKGKTCDLKTINKETLEKLVVDTCFEVLKGSDLLSDYADMIIQRHKQKQENNSYLNLYLRQKEAVQKSIDNLMIAIEQGIITSSTKERLEELEKQKKEIDERILIEKAKAEEPIDKKEVIKYIKTALSKEPKLMVRQLIQKILVYNDKIEIYFKYTKKPDDNDQASFIYRGSYKITSSSYKFAAKKEHMKNDVVTEYVIECFI